MLNLDSVFRIIKNLNNTELEGIQFMYKLLVQKSIDLSIFTPIECDQIQVCSGYAITINDIFLAYFRNNSIVTNKKYAKYYTDERVSKWLIGNNPVGENILDGNVTINGCYPLITSGKKVGYQANPIISDLIGESLLATELLFENRDRTNLYLYDTIFFNIPSDVHNITHASCANYVKKLKIRGTSYEALTLQMISLLLARKGTAYITISDSFLMSDTTQIVQTRKYLTEFFNVTEIIKIDECFYPVKDTLRGSIMVLQEGAKTDSIKFSLLTLDASTGQAVKQNTHTIPMEMITANNYNFTHHVYNSKKLFLPIKGANRLTFSDVFEYHTTADQAVGTYLCVDKQGIPSIGNFQADNKYAIALKNPKDHVFLLYYADHYIRKYPNLNLDCISIPDIPADKCEEIYQQLLLDDGQAEIVKNLRLKKQLLDLYHSKCDVTLGDICTMEEKIRPGPVITIINNAANVGRATYYETDTPPVKSQWVVFLKETEKWNLKFIYYYVDYYLEHLQRISRMKTQNYVSRTNVSDLKLPAVPLEIQEKIIGIFTNYENTGRNVHVTQDLLFQFHFPDIFLF